jgi:hypothetical protein
MQAVEHCRLVDRLNDHFDVDLPSFVAADLQLVHRELAVFAAVAAMALELAVVEIQQVAAALAM